MKLTMRTILEIAHHEAVVRQAYKDSGGVWTWSVGITSDSGHSVERYKGNPQTMTKCIEVYVWLLETKYLPSVLKAFEGYTLKEHELAAALSFHWNTGAISRAAWVKHVKAGNTAAAKKAFLSWRKPAEIIPRRTAERDLFFDVKWANQGTITEYTRVSPKGSPVWSSANKVDVSSAVMSALGVDKPLPITPKPIPQVAQEAVAPQVTAPRDEPSLFAAIASALASIFRKKS